MSRAARVAETRGRAALTVGRGTPGLRTVTVVAAAASGLGWRRGGSEAWAEASCPACLGLALIAGRVPALSGLAGPGISEPGISAAQEPG